MVGRSRRDRRLCVLGMFLKNFFSTRQVDMKKKNQAIFKQCPCVGATLDKLVQPAMLAILAKGPPLPPIKVVEPRSASQDKP